MKIKVNARRVLVGLTIALVTFSVGVSSAMIWAKRSRQHLISQEQIAARKLVEQDVKFSTTGIMDGRNVGTELIETSDGEHLSVTYEGCHSIERADWAMYVRESLEPFTWGSKAHLYWTDGTYLVTVEATSLRYALAYEMTHQH